MSSVELKKLSVYTLTAFAIVTLTGCDAVNVVSEYFSGKKSEEKIEAPFETVPREGQAVVSAMGQVEPAKTEVDMTNAVARVDDWTLSQQDFYERLAAIKEVAPEFDVNTVENRAAILEELLNQQILVSYAEDKGLMDEKDIQAAIEEFRRTLLVRELARRITQDVDVTEEEAVAFYEEQKQFLVTPTEYKVRWIVTDTQGKAKDVLVKALEGDDFGALAQKFSLAENADNGGDLGFISDVPFQEMGNALLALAVGDTSGVFQGPDGRFYIIKLEEKRGGETIPYREIREEIIQNQLIGKQQQLMIEFLNQIKEGVEIEINEELL